jgi:hypothetical protein
MPVSGETLVTIGKVVQAPTRIPSTVDPAATGLTVIRMA